MITAGTLTMSVGKDGLNEDQVVEGVRALSSHYAGYFVIVGGGGDESQLLRSLTARMGPHTYLQSYDYPTSPKGSAYIIYNALRVELAHAHNDQSCAALERSEYRKISEGYAGLMYYARRY